MRKTRDDKRHDAHARAVDQANRTMKELEMLLDHQKSLVVAFRAKLAKKGK